MSSNCSSVHLQLYREQRLMTAIVNIETCEMPDKRRMGERHHYTEACCGISDGSGA